MSWSIYNYACLLIAFWIFRICVRSILALRFHFRFGRLGFFSINNIQYHHHKSSETAWWSVKVGKIKLRLRRRPKLSSPTPFITIHVADIQVQLHSLAALKQPQGKSSRLSRVSSSLQKIPWWYSLSVVKHVIKFTSALPAQLLMAGLANYVDLQVDNFNLEIEQQAVIKVRHVNFSSVLFANVTASVPSSTGGLSRSYQRHSLKRAQHLFKEKFFEILVQVGKVSVESDQEMLSLPTGGQVAVSCHLSAGCVTLKDVDVNARVDTLQLKLVPLLQLAKNISSKQQDAKKQANHKIIQLLRSITLSVDNTIVETQQDSTVVFQEIYVKGTAEAYMDSYYKLHVLMGMITWHVLETRMMTIPEIKLTANIAAQCLFAPKRNSLELNEQDEGPNQTFMSATLIVVEPKFCLDVSKVDLLHTVFKSNQQSKEAQHGTKMVSNLPKASVSICIERPSVHLQSTHMGVISWSSITLEANGIYSAQRPSSVSHSSEPLTTDGVESIQRKHSRSSWTNLFRRSWRSKNSPKNNIEWLYKVSFCAIVNHTCIDHIGQPLKVDCDPNAFISVSKVEMSVDTKLNVSFVDQHIQAVWGDDRPIHVSMAVQKPVVNLWANKTADETQLEFWMNHILSKFGSREKTVTTDQPTRVNIYHYLSVAKIHLTIKHAAWVVEGVDKGLKGTRAVPTGYLDNAPLHDMEVRIVSSIQHLSCNFSGSQLLFQGHHASHSVNSIDSDTEQQENAFGKARISIHHVIVERIFKQDSLDDNWHHHEGGKSALFWISRINARMDMALDASKRVVLQPSIVVKKNGILYSITNHYACLVTALSTAALLKRCFRKKQEKASAKKAVISQLQFQINRSDIHVFLPNGDTELYIRMDSLRTQWNNDVEHHGEMPPTAIRNLVIYGTAPHDPTQWDQILELDSMRFSIEKDVDFSTGTLVKTNQLSMSKLYMRIPYGYELANFVDSTVTLIKGIKAMHARLKKGHAFLFFGPNEKKVPALLPHMRLVCDVLSLQFEDDPFEARLRSIYKTGLVEQANRIAIQDAFEIKAQTFMQHPSERRYSERDSVYMDQETDARVNEAWQGLQEHNSKSWIRHIDAALDKETSSYRTLQAGYYRHSQLDDTVDDPQDEKTLSLCNMFCIQVVDLPLYPPLLDLTIKSTSLDFRPPDFNVNQTRQFIFDVGKGQPLDTPLSTLIPFHLDWESGETWAQLRDYPIPFILVPQNEASCAWKLSGDYVLGDDLGHLDATRSIHIPIVDEMHYAIDVARTSTPLKFFSIVNIHVHNSGLSHMCWSVPYQPAIQDISRVMDTFTKSPVDPSPKIGIWDKIRLIIHTRVKISFIGGGDLAIVMKGSRDPYDMTEKGFGLAKVWRNDVVLLLGDDNAEGEFMQIISQDYAFGVPDLVRGGYTAPYILATADDSTKQKEMRQSDSLSSFNSTRDDESRFVKIALKLSGGIRMGLGCHLERTCPAACETCDSEQNRESHKAKMLEFLPHYKVKLRAPQNVYEKNYDAYKGFRSDKIHASLSIIKFKSDTDKNTITGNSMHLTPGFLDHFVAWFRLFGGAMGYPLRDGSLFPKTDTRPSQKFGRHMSTMKYKVVVDPITVGCFIKDENVDADKVTTEELGDSVGVKGFVKYFSIDMHQRREIVNVSNYKLDQKRLKANWPICEAEIQLKNIDLRAVRASYAGDESLSSSGAENVSMPVDYLSDSSDLDMMEGLNYQCNNDSDSSDWVDLDDFIEMDVATPAILPAIQVLPFAFSPCIYYLRHTTRDDIQNYRYLHRTHDCILGTTVDTKEMQMTLLHDRSKSIDVQIRKHQTRLHNIEVKRMQQGSDATSLQEMSDAIVEKTRILYEKRELLQRYLKELSRKTMPDHKSDVYANSTIFGKDSLAQWEELMGYFKVRYIAHSPQILWNNSVRNILYHALDLRDHRRALTYYMTSRTVKFLRDLIEASDLHYGDKFVLDHDEGGMDSSMAQDLIAKLLAEQDTKFYAPNETEQDTVQDNHSSPVDMSRSSDNVNNPTMQLKTIPTNYVMKSSYLVDLLNPQISLQSDCDPDNIVLVANERTQVKGFNIIDETDPDVEMEMVKHRTIVSLDNVQFYVAKKEQFDSVDLLLDNHYGAKESDHWLAWIPPEMLISYVKGSDKFQRIGDRIAATLQYDKYNPLRIKKTSLFSQVHPFEDRCDSVQLNFPKLKMTADSAQYNAVYQVATDLLLYKEPAKRERLGRLREIMMAADRASLFETTEKIVDLQNRARHLIHARDQYRENMALLDQKRIEEFKSIRLTLYDTMEELYLGMEAIKLMQSNQRRDYHEPKTNLKFVFCAEKLVWEMLSKGEVPLCEWNLTNLNFIFVSKEDHSSINTLEVDLVQVKNTSPSPVFVDVLGPYYDPRKAYDFSRHKMLRCYFVSLAPVGGIPVIQHLETNLHPLRVQMTYSFGKALAYYLFPPEKRQKTIESAPMVTSTSTPTSSSMAEFDTEMSQSAVTLPLLQSTSEKTDRDGLKSSGSAKSFDSAPANLSPGDAQRSSVHGSLSMTLRDDAEPDATDGLSSSVILPVPSSSKKTKKMNKLAKYKAPDDLSVMKKRASSNRAFILVKIPGARHCLSYQGPKDKNIEDLRDFAFEQPTLEFRNETWSWFELASNIRKDFMRAALLHNSTALLKEKLLRRHPRDKLSETSTVSSFPENDRPYDADNNSDMTESSREEDVVSLHSFEAESPEVPQKRHIWSKITKPRKSLTPTEPKLAKSVPDIMLHTSSNNHFPVDAPPSDHRTNGEAPVLMRSVSAVTRHLQDDDQLTVKGKYLLGKYYNGPTQWLAKGAARVKGKQALKK